MKTIVVSIARSSSRSLIQCNKTASVVKVAAQIKFPAYVSTNRYFSSQSEESAKTEEEPKVEEAAPAPAKSPEQELIEKLQLEVRDLKDQVLRSLAEEENVRRIAKRDVAQAKTYANSSFAKSLLDVADTLDMAIKADTSKLSPEAAFKVLQEGIIGTGKNLTKVFEKNGITRYGEVGDKFDPSLHDALFEMPDPSKENGVIAQIVKAGYKLNDRVIRAAEVGTVRNN